MAQIDPPVPPPRLFRYRNLSQRNSLNQELDAILHCYLWCSQYKALNDPMEGVYGVSPWLAEQPTLNEFGKKILNHKRSLGVCCFSDTNDNELMWTHYAGNYCGICVEYSTKQLLAGLGADVHLVRVAYDGQPPRIGEADLSSPQQAARRILSHKKACWLYEREWRVLTETEPIPRRLNIDGGRAVKAVYLGSRVNADAKTKLEQKLTQKNIPVWIMKVSGYRHEWKKLGT